MKLDKVLMNSSSKLPTGYDWQVSISWQLLLVLNEDKCLDNCHFDLSIVKEEPGKLPLAFGQI